MKQPACCPSQAHDGCSPPQLSFPHSPVPRPLWDTGVIGPCHSYYALRAGHSPGIPYPEGKLAAYPEVSLALK